MPKEEYDVQFEKLLDELTQAKLAVDDAALEDRDEKQRVFDSLKKEFSLFCVSRNKKRPA